MKKIILALVLTISLGIMSSCRNQEINCNQELQKIEKEYDEKLRTELKKRGFLARDPREKERKKYNLVKARKAHQYTKR